MGCSPSGSSVHGILQARILEWVAISFSRGSSRPRDKPVGKRVSLLLAPPGKPFRLGNGSKERITLEFLEQRRHRTGTTCASKSCRVSPAGPLARSWDGEAGGDLLTLARPWATQSLCFSLGSEFADSSITNILDSTEHFEVGAASFFSEPYRAQSWGSRPGHV